ncbi:coiled-coil domain-containing protein 25, partial [Cyanocitta cristata]
MVFYFTSNAVPAVYTIYMGKDKYENEDLIKYGWPEDVWFHVDKLSSAHVYLRLHKSDPGAAGEFRPQGQTMDDIPKEVLSDCAHLVKANSIQGTGNGRKRREKPGKRAGMAPGMPGKGWEMGGNGPEMPGKGWEKLGMPWECREKGGKWVGKGQEKLGMPWECWEK